LRLFAPISRDLLVSIRLLTRLIGAVGAIRVGPGPSDVQVMATARKAQGALLSCYHSRKDVSATACACRHTSTPLQCGRFRWFVRLSWRFVLGYEDVRVWSIPFAASDKRLSVSARAKSRRDACTDVPCALLVPGWAPFMHVVGRGRLSHTSIPCKLNAMLANAILGRISPIPLVARLCNSPIVVRLQGRMSTYLRTTALRAARSPVEVEGQVEHCTSLGLHLIRYIPSRMYISPGCPKGCRGGGGVRAYRPQRFFFGPCQPAYSSSP